MAKTFCLIIFLGIRTLCCALDEQSVESSYPNFRDNPYLDEEMRRSAAPFLLPLDHPIKSAVDVVFSKERVVQDQNTLKEAGFEIIAAMPGSFVVVARHPKVPGYVFKLYLDVETRTRDGIPNYLWLIKRCVGAAYIRNLIERKNLRYFAVPDKWLYILPWDREVFLTNHTPFVVIATDMQLEEEEVSRHVWKTQVSRRHLKELYKILKRGHGSKRLVENIPYTKQRVFAFTDTEYPVRKHKLVKVKPYLSKEMQEYWDRLIQ